METLLGVEAEELRSLNRGFGGTFEMNGTIKATFHSASYKKNFWERVAIVVRSIAGGHLFDNGNKRTAFAAVHLFRSRNNTFTGVHDPQLREVIRRVAIHELEEIEEIAARLRGF